MGWAGIKNGELLPLVDAAFEIFVTSDKNLRFQQNLATYGMAIVLLPSNQVPVVEVLLPMLDALLDQIQAQSFVEL